MKKFLLSLFVILITGGMAIAGGIPNTIDPQSGPFFGAIPVFNNSGGTLSAGDLVVWDIGSSTGDNDAYVTTTTNADTGIVAGIIWPAQITDQNVGSMATWGVVQCDFLNTVQDGDLICSSTTAGESAVCSNEDAAFGISVASTTNTTGNCFISP